MTNKISEILLLKYRGGVNSSVFTGRPQGETARHELGLDKLDKNQNIIHFIIPQGTTTITPSFFLGLLFESIFKLGFDKYKEKYIFKYKDENPDIIVILESNIAEGERNALNNLKSKRGYSKFIKK